MPLRADRLSCTRHQHGVDVLLANAKWLPERPAGMRDAVMEAGRLAQEEIRLWVAATQEKTILAQQQGSRLDDVDVVASGGRWRR